MEDDIVKQLQEETLSMLFEKFIEEIPQASA
jgi:hypothetical protein